MISTAAWVALPFAVVAMLWSATLLEDGAMQYPGLAKRRIMLFVLITATAFLGAFANTLVAAKRATPTIEPPTMVLTEVGHMAGQKLVPAESLIPQDNIVVNLSAMEGGPGGSRTPIQATFNGLGQRTGPDNIAVYGARGLTIKAGGAGAPVFNLAEYQRLSAAGNKAAAAQLVAAHSAAVDAWQGGGNQRLPDLIAEAVVQFCKDEFGIRTDDGPWPVLKLDQLVVKPAHRTGEGVPTTFIVQGAPVWG